MTIANPRCSTAVFAHNVGARFGFLLDDLAHQDLFRGSSGGTVFFLENGSRKRTVEVAGAFGGCSGFPL